MPDIVNPYIPDHPVDNPDLFFGRRDILTSIREHLVKGRRVFVVSSARRMGKTSLLGELPRHLPDEFIPVRLDLSQEKARRFDRLLWCLAKAIDRQVGRKLGGEGLEPSWADFEGDADQLLDHFWPRIRDVLGNRGLVLLLDDVDALVGNQVNLLDTLIAFLSMWRDRDGSLAMVLTMTMAWQEALIRQHARLFGGALTFALGPLSSEEASRLITWPVDGVLTYDYGVARRLIEITSGQPYYLQLLCFEVFNRCALSGWVNQRDVDLVIEELVGREITDFRQVWDESSPPEQATLAALVSLRGARGVATAQEVGTVLSKAGARAGRGQVTGALESLVARGILERLGALSYRFRVALLRDWLGERIDLQEVVRKTRMTRHGAAYYAAPYPGPPAGDQEMLTSDRRVRKLRVGEPQPRAPLGSGQEPKEAAEGTEEESATTTWPRRLPWAWIGIAVVLALILLVAAGRVLSPSFPDEPVPAETVWPSSTPRLAIATKTSVSQVPTKAVAVVASPTDTPRSTPTVPVLTAPVLTAPVLTGTPTPTAPVVMGRPLASIAYQSRSAGERGWSLYVMNSDGSNRTRLTDGQAEFLSAPAWSPDGARIAYVSDRAGTADIWVTGSDGSDPVNLTQHAAKDHSPAWSPDGQWIAFASVRDSPFWELYLMRADGSDLQRLTWWEDASDLWPSWSPDGTRLAFASKRDGDWEIYVISVPGEATADGAEQGSVNLMRLTDHPADDTTPTWSPDGSRIAFASTREGYAEIYVMPVAGGEAVNVSRLAWATDLGPTWSPDGGRISFYSDRDGDWDIYVMNSDGSDVVKLTGDTSNDQVPAWRP